MSASEILAQGSLVDESTGCWNWQRSKCNGYGRLTFNGRTVRAHRLSHETFIGPIPADKEVCHKCDNKACINPAHLYAGTRQQNVDDREARWRNFIARGEVNGQAKLTEEKVALAKRLRAEGLIYRHIADQLGVDKMTAMRAIKGQQWAHLNARHRFEELEGVHT